MLAKFRNPLRFSTNLLGKRFFWQARESRGKSVEFVFSSAKTHTWKVSIGPWSKRRGVTRVKRHGTGTSNGEMIVLLPDVWQAFGSAHSLIKMWSHPRSYGVTRVSWWFFLLLRHWSRQHPPVLWSALPSRCDRTNLFQPDLSHFYLIFKFAQGCAVSGVVDDSFRRKVTTEQFAKLIVLQ